MTETKKSAITNAQQKYLLNEINKHARNRWDFKREPLPASLKSVESQIKRLQTKLDRFHKQQEKQIDRKKKKLDVMVADARKEAYFGTPASALKALEQIRKKYPAKG